MFSLKWINQKFFDLISTEPPVVPVKTSPSSSSALQAYIHQHAWLLYASLTLTLSDAVYSQETGFTYMDSDYFKVACQLQQQCLDQAIHCLDQVSAEIDGQCAAIDWTFTKIAVLDPAFVVPICTLECLFLWSITKFSYDRPGNVSCIFFVLFASY